MKHTAPLALCAVIMLSQTACERQPLVVTKDNADTFYRGFQKLMNEPRPMAFRNWMLCRGPNAEEQEKEKARMGIHYGYYSREDRSETYVQYYANDGGKRELDAKTEKLSEGTVIVKEKITRKWLNGMLDGPIKHTVTDIAGMIKRAPGYDPANGDWEYFFYTPGKSFETGKLANCIGCHSGAAKDFVFRQWKTKKDER